MEKREEKQVKKIKGGNLLLDIFNLISQGKNQHIISQELNISKQRVNYYFTKLKQQNSIQKKGYGVWEVKTSQTLPQVAKTRGHAFMWKIRLPKEIIGHNFKSLLDRKQVKYRLIGISKTPSILIKGKKVWLGKKNIIIYDLESYIGINAIDTRKYAVSRLLEVLKTLEKQLELNFKPYEFQVARHHYSLIKNCLAIQCNKSGQKIEVYNSKGYWFIIDNSFNLNEAETIHPETALIDSIGIQKYFNEHKDTKFEVTPKFVLNMMNGIQQNQLTFAENMESHIEAIQNLSKQVKRLSRVFKSTIVENKKLKLGNQKQLKEFGV